MEAEHKVNEGEAAKRRREKVAESRRKSRLRQKIEVETLREENKQMKDEQKKLMAKIMQLESQVENKISTSDVDAIVENNALKMEIDMHKRFIDSFMKLADGPSSLSGQRLLCREGAESAQAYVQGLVADSQSTWTRLDMPEGFAVPVEDLILHYCFRENFFGEKDSKRMKRFNFRLDMTFPSVKAEDIATYYWNLYNSSEEQKNCFGVRALELEQIDMPDKDTRLMYNRKTWRTPQHSPSDVSFCEKDQDVVFICNRLESVMPRSSLQPPSLSPGSSSSVSEDSSCSDGACGQDYFGGSTKVTTIAMTSTRSTHETLKSYSIESKGSSSISNASGSSPSDAESEDDGLFHITSVISQGALCWDDEKRGGARLVCVLSYPEEFRWLDYSFSDIVDSDGKIGIGFAHLLVGVTTRLYEVIYGIKVPYC